VSINATGAKLARLTNRKIQNKGGLSKMYKKILVPLDGSDLAECALEHVKAIATGCNVPEVILLRIVEPTSSFSTGELAASNAKLATQVEQQVEKEHQTQAQQYISNKVNKLKREGIAVTSEIISGKAADGILNYAEKNNIDLIIMSTHGRSGISRWAFGSTADKVSHYSTVPVLIVSPRGCRIAVI
jgi:nucleotide-binding universal stress UspA family protein